MKKLQALYNNNANKIIKQAAQEKGTIKNLNFLIFNQFGNGFQQYQTTLD